MYNYALLITGIVIILAGIVFLFSGKNTQGDTTITIGKFSVKTPHVGIVLIIIGVALAYFGRPKDADQKTADPAPKPVVIPAPVVTDSVTKKKDSIPPDHANLSPDDAPLPSIEKVEMFPGDSLDIYAAVCLRGDSISKEMEQRRDDIKNKAFYNKTAIIKDIKGKFSVMMYGFPKPKSYEKIITATAKALGIPASEFDVIDLTTLAPAGLFEYKEKTIRLYWEAKN